MNRALLSSKKTEWGTPHWLYQYLDRHCDFTIDTCASALNHKHARYFDRRVNTLEQRLDGDSGLQNPPYGKRIGEFCSWARDQALERGSLMMNVLPARVDADWWRRFIMSADSRPGKLVHSHFESTTQVLWLRWRRLISGVHFYPRRVKFQGARTTAPFPTALAWHSSVDRPVPRPRLLAGELNLFTGWPS